jgi:HSP20 family protein
MRYRSPDWSIFFLPAAEAGSGMVWKPSADIYRSCHGWLIKFDLAGVERKDITITACGSRLTVSGHRRDWMVQEEWSHYSMEITYSRFERTLELPCDLERASISADFREGMLLVRVTTEGEKS